MPWTRAFNIYLTIFCVSILVLVMGVWEQPKVDPVLKLVTVYDNNSAVW